MKRILRKGEDIHPLVKELKVLIVDSQPFARKRAKEALYNMGVPTVYETVNVNSALAGITKAGISLVIVDAFLPDDTGLRLLRAVRTGQQWLRRDLPVLVWTELTDPEIRSAAKALDANDVIPKETDLGGLEPRIIDVLEKPVRPRGTYAYVSAPVPSGERVGQLYEKMLKRRMEGMGEPVAYDDLHVGKELPHDLMTLNGQFLLAKGRRLDASEYRLLEEIERTFGLCWGK